MNMESKSAVQNFKDITPMNVKYGSAFIPFQNLDCPEFIRQK
jgi:hypothetical protein